MRVYYLHLEKADFVASGDVWASAVIDLYDNASYRNFSVTKASYGLNSLGDRTWTGLHLEGASATDSGLISGGRFVDTTGRIDIISYSLVAETSSSVPVEGRLTVRASQDGSEPRYAAASNVSPSDGISITDSDRYVEFVLDFGTPPASGYDFTLDVRIEIAVPVMAPRYRSLDRVLYKFPEWMAMREADQALDPPATPTTLGSGLINAMSAEWIEDLAQLNRYGNLQTYIETADLNQLAWAYKIVGTPDFVRSVKGDGVELARAVDEREFHDSEEHDDVMWWDEEDDVIYFRKKYTSVLLNDVDERTGEAITPQHLWNWFDEIGLLVDLPRLHLESNLNYRSRILDVYINKGGVGREQFKLALRRELDLWRYHGSTPDSSFAGATPEVLEMLDIEEHEDYVTPEGLPTEKFVSLVDRLSREYPITWGRFLWGRARWDMGGPRHEGFGVLPYSLDATPLSWEDTKSGVGGADDLLVYHPSKVTGPHDFNVTARARGRRREYRTEHPVVSFDVKVYGQADRVVYDNPEVEVWFTLYAFYSGDGGYTHTFPMRATSGINVGVPDNPESARSVYEFMAPDGLSVEDALWYDDDTAEVEGRLNLTEATSIVLSPGRWDYEADDYADVPDDEFLAWLSTNEAAKMDHEGYLSVNLSTRPLIVMESTVTSSSVGTWTSEPVVFPVNVNGELPGNTVHDRTLELPPIVWDNYIETGSEEIVVELATTEDDVNFGAMTTDANLQEFMLGTEYIYMNGSNAWPDQKQFLDPSETEVTFSIGEGVEYPVERAHWTMVEFVQNSDYLGIVDENGPWRDGEIPTGVDTSYLLTELDLDRSDFSIPETDDYVITWMGVESSDPNVMVWLDSNSVKPAVSDGSTLEYPAASIEEQYDEDLSVYHFAPFRIYARLRPDISPEWNPKVNAGWFYDHQDEYYFYARPYEESVTAQEHVLDGVNRQGAPIIVSTVGAEQSRTLRQVAFADATPNLTIENTQVVQGTGTEFLYLAYNDVHSVKVINLATGQDVTFSTETDSNVVEVDEMTSRDVDYEVSYILAYSFYADNDYIEDGEARTRLYFDKAPAAVGADSYLVTYESSMLNPATPINLPLNPLYTSVEEGYIFISYDEHTLHKVELRLSPGVIIADGLDYMVVTIKSLDNYGNPKGGATFSLSTNFGTLSSEEVTVDNNGHAAVVLSSSEDLSTLAGMLTVSGDIEASVPFRIQAPTSRRYRLLAVPSAEEIPAAAEESMNYIFGRVEDPDYRPVPGAVVEWTKARSMYELFGDPEWASVEAGQVYTNERGEFTVGPIESATPFLPGYWFVALETGSATPIWPAPATPTEEEFDAVGDVVFWNEYPIGTYGYDDLTGLPRQAVQMATPISAIPPYSTNARFPVYYDEDEPDGATPNSINWMPPQWYAIDRYSQYQLGLLGSTPNDVDDTSLTDSHPPGNDV